MKHQDAREGRVMKAIKLLCLLFIYMLFAYVIYLDEQISRKITTPGYYKGTVVEMAEDPGRNGSTYYLNVNWDGIGMDDIVVHPLTYNRTQIGDRISTQFVYSYWLGAIGTSTSPDTGENNWILGLARSLSVVGLIILTLFLLGRFIWSKRFVKSKE